jgi:hypothetical protein
MKPTTDTGKAVAAAIGATDAPTDYGTKVMKDVTPPEITPGEIAAAGTNNSTTNPIPKTGISTAPAPRQR